MWYPPDYKIWMTCILYSHALDCTKCHLNPFTIGCKRQPTDTGRRATAPQLGRWTFSFGLLFVCVNLYLSVFWCFFFVKWSNRRLQSQQICRVTCLECLQFLAQDLKRKRSRADTSRDVQSLMVTTFHRESTMDIAGEVPYKDISAMISNIFKNHQWSKNERQKMGLPGSQDGGCRRTGRCFVWSLWLKHQAGFQHGRLQNLLMFHCFPLFKMKLLGLSCTFMVE